MGRKKDRRKGRWAWWVGGLQQKESSSMFCILWRVWALRQIPFCVRMMASVSCLFSICPPKIAAFETEYSSLKITAPRHGLYHLVLFSTFFLYLYLKYFFSCRLVCLIFRVFRVFPVLLVLLVVLGVDYRGYCCDCNRGEVRRQWRNWPGTGDNRLVYWDWVGRRFLRTVWSVHYWFISIGRSRVIDSHFWWGSGWGLMETWCELTSIWSKTGWKWTTISICIVPNVELVLEANQWNFASVFLFICFVYLLLISRSFFVCFFLLYLDDERQAVTMDTPTELPAKWTAGPRYRRRSTAGTICQPSANPNSPRWRASSSRGNGAYGANPTNSKPSPKVLLLQLVQLTSRLLLHLLLRLLLNAPML